MKYFALSLLLLLASANVWPATWHIYYAKPAGEFDLRTTYPLSVLSLALEHTGVRYNLVSTEKVVEQGRAIKLLKANREVSVVWTMTDPLREEELLPIRIPIYKGLIGWRIFLVKDKYQDLFSNFSQLEELRQYAPVQGYDWPDTKILQANGFEVVTGSYYEQLFEVLNVERANFFPRSIVEIWAELEQQRQEYELAVEPYLALQYPTAMYFFFNKKNVVLANLIETGLERAIKSGDFDRLFMRVHEPFLQRANIDNRIIFQLDNPILPENTPIGDASLWYSVDNN